MGVEKQKQINSDQGTQGRWRKKGNRGVDSGRKRISDDCEGEMNERKRNVPKEVMFFLNVGNKSISSCGGWPRTEASKLSLGVKKTIHVAVGHS